MGSTLAKEVQPTTAKARGHSHALMHILLFWGTVFWASNIVAGKEAVNGFGGMGLAQLRLAGAAILFVALFLAWPGRPELRLSGRQWLVLTVVGFNGMTLNQICFINGLARTSVAHTGLIVALGPVMVLALSCLMRLEPLTLPKFLGMLISFGGVAILTLGGAEKGSAAHWQGDLIVLAGSASFAYYTIQVKEIANLYDALTLNTLTFAIGSLLMIPFAARSVLNIRWANVPLAAWGGLGIHGRPGYCSGLPLLRVCSYRTFRVARGSIRVPPAGCGGASGRMAARRKNHAEAGRRRSADSPRCVPG